MMMIVMIMIIMIVMMMMMMVMQVEDDGITACLCTTDLCNNPATASSSSRGGAVSTRSSVTITLAPATRDTTTATYTGVRAL